MTKKKWCSMIISLSLVLVLALVACLLNYTNTTLQTRTTTIEISRQEIDYQSLLDEFDDGKLEQQGSLTTFEGYKSLNLADLEGIDLTSDSTLSENSEVNVKYNFSYDKETNIVTLSAELKDEFGEIQIDTLTGAAFINDYGEIDAVMNVDGEGILLSEMKDAGMIANCGWFSRLIKKIVKVVVVAVTIAVVAVATAAVVVATAGAAAPALVAAGVGVTTSATLGMTAGVAAGTLFAATVGMSALKAGTAFAEKLGDGAERIIDNVSGKILSIIVKDVEYVTVVMTSTLIYELEKNSYHLTAVSNDGVVYISLTPIDRTLATWATRLNIPIYTYYSENAYQVAKDAGDGLLPYLDKAHIYKNGKLQTGIFFDHWHTHNHVGHCFFGVPVIN